jgi:hypothetical protein
MGVKLTKEQEKSQSSLPQQINVTAIRLEPLENAATFYVNHIEVGSSAHDFSLICGRLPGKLSLDQFEEVKGSGALVVEPEVQVVIPATLVIGLIKALTAQKDNYEKTYGVALKEIRNVK